MGGERRGNIREKTQKFGWCEEVGEEEGERRIGIRKEKEKKRERKKKKENRIGRRTRKKSRNTLIRRGVIIFTYNTKKRGEGERRRERTVYQREAL